MVFSFDIFDTCLVRLCGEPHNLIEVLSKDFFDEKDELQRQMFIANRVKADDGSGGGLVAIYERMASGCPLPMTAHDMAECEMQLEHKMLVAIATTKKLVDALRANGRIMFVSDMYLPSDFLRDVLKEQGFYHDGDLLYVSDEHNASKRDGSLFQLIHEREGIPYRKWHHYGDNKHSDYHIPSRFGIHAHYLHFPYLHYEKLWIAHPSLQYQYSSILAGVSRAARLHHDVPAEQGAFVSNIAALTLTSWVVHILTDASNRGISRLYFCARGTHAEYIIARKLAPLFPRIKVHYLFISTEALNSPLVLPYLEQELLACRGDEKTAIVDGGTRGRTLHIINQILTKSGYNKIYGYFIRLCNIATESDKKNTYTNDAEFFFNDYFLLLNHIPQHTQSITDILNLSEHVFSLNYHPRTIGYQFVHKKLLPIFSKQAIDVHLKSIKTLKRQSDQIIETFAQGFRLTHLPSYNQIILNTIILPTAYYFALAPSKKMLRYIHQTDVPQIENIARVNNLFSIKGRRNRWLYGCAIYTLPQPFAYLFTQLYKSKKFRRKLNHIVSRITNHHK